MPRVGQPLEDRVFEQQVRQQEQPGITAIGEKKNATKRILLFPQGSSAAFTAEHYVSKHATGSRPAILVVGGLGGEYGPRKLVEKKWIRALTERGFDTFYIHRPSVKRVVAVLDPLEEYNKTMAETVERHSRVLNFIHQVPSLQEKHTGILGVSYGGIIAVEILKREPSIQYACIGFSGAIEETIAQANSKSRLAFLRAFAEKAEQYGGMETVMERFRGAQYQTGLETRPFNPEDILFIQARKDKIIPPAASDTFYELFKRPRKIIMPGGHIRGVLLSGKVGNLAGDFFQERYATEALKTAPVLSSE